MAYWKLGQPAVEAGGEKRMHVTVQLTRKEGPDPPYDHNFLLGSAVYQRLKKTSDKAADILHDSHERSAYVLSEIHRVSGKPKEAWFRMGTSNTAVVNLLVQAFAPGTELRIGKSRFRVREAHVEEPTVRPGQFVTLSPILLEDPGSHRSLVHDSEGYHASLQQAINAQIDNHLGEAGSVSVMQIVPQAVRKRTIDGGTFLAQKARLTLQGVPEHLSFLVNHGIGNSPALGFGMVVLDRNKPGPTPPREG